MLTISAKLDILEECAIRVSKKQSMVLSMRELELIAALLAALLEYSYSSYSCFS